METLAMLKIAFSISLVSGAFLIFIILCSPILSVPVFFLLLYLFLLQGAFIWMVLAILKNGSPSHRTFDD